ncbi:MAG: hypothetical protein HYV63_04795 [Candidatus Schekmanbacteria bacterium]|nr:hypothetical protein [Candidatus Schekmanbacteria bacterium]
MSHTRSTARRIVRLVSAIFALMAAAACSDSSEPDHINYFAQTSFPPANAVALLTYNDGHDYVDLALQGVSWDDRGARRIELVLKYEPTVSKFDSYRAGAMFERVGSPRYTIADDPAAGLLNIVVENADDAPGAAGTATVVYLKFTPLDDGGSYLKFRNAAIRTAPDAGASLVTGISWFGGVITVF